MKKILLSVAFLAATFTGVNAQTTLIDEDFEDFQNWTEDTTWYVFDNSTEENSLPWQIFSANQFNDVGMPTITTASSSFYAVGQDLFPYAVDNFRLSPIVELPSTDNQLTLTFDLASYGAATASLGFSVVVINQSQLADENFDFGNATTVYTSTLTGGMVNSSNISVDLSNDVTFGELVMFGFRHNGSTGLGYVIVDNVTLVSSTTASTGDFTSSAFSVYPNPVKDVLNISNSNGAEINSLTIVDINGRTVKQINSNVSQINISDLNAGVYFVNINSTEGNLTKKVVKQ